MKLDLKTISKLVALLAGAAGLFIRQENTITQLQQDKADAVEKRDLLWMKATAIEKALAEHGIYVEKPQDWK